MRVVLTEPGLLLRPASTDLSDLTASERAGSPWWESDGMALNIPFDPEPSPAEQVLIRRRLMTRDADHEAWVAAVVVERDAISRDNPTSRLLLLHTEAALRGIDAP